MYDAVLLSAALGFPTKCPPAPITRSIRMMFSDKVARPATEDKPFKKIIKVVRQKPRVSKAMREVLAVLKKQKTLTAAEAAKYTRWTQNHCGILLSSLHKEGLAKRTRFADANTRWYVYTPKEQVNDKS